jgi:hypothetical protein
LERLRQRLERLHRRLVLELLLRQQLVPGLLQRLPQAPWLLPKLARPRMLELLPGR